MKEDIELIEKMIKEYKQFGDLDNPEFEDTDRIYQAIENLLKGYKELEEDNTEWRGKYLIELAKVSDLEKEILHWKGQYHLLSRKINSIPISVIQNKIDELDKQYKKILSKYGNIHTDILFDVNDKDDMEKLNTIIDQIMILKELLGERTK